MNERATHHRGDLRVLLEDGGELWVGLCHVDRDGQAPVQRGRQEEEEDVAAGLIPGGRVVRADGDAEAC